MVTQATSLTRNGVSDWIVQRITAYILAAYTVFLVGYVLLAGDLTFEAWHGLFATTWMKIFTLLAILSTCAHAWIGMWTIGTDYIRPGLFGLGAGAGRLRYLYQMGCGVVLVVYVIWGIQILWGM